MPDGGTPFAIGIDSDGGQGGLYGFQSARDLLVLADALVFRTLCVFEAW